VGHLILGIAGGFALAVLALVAGSGVALAFLLYALSGAAILIVPVGRLALAEAAARPRRPTRPTRRARAA
jgi:hypothetical protein